MNVAQITMAVGDMLRESGDHLVAFSPEPVDFQARQRQKHQHQRLCAERMRGVCQPGLAQLKAQVH